VPRAQKPQTIEEYKAWFASLGGKARRDALSPTDRKAAASMAARSRWAKTSKAERRKAALKAIRARWAKVKKTTT
jgi:hypothetical protein